MAREPLRPRGKPKRWILVTPELDAVLDGRDRIAGFPNWEADHIMGMFIAGWLVTVGKQRESEADLKRLECVDEVWALSFRKPAPGWRVLGRFLEPDVFVALTHADRHALAGERYTELADETIEEWQKRFGSLEPFRSDDLTAYLTGTVRNVDKEE